jgi:hypothetical protein
MSSERNDTHVSGPDNENNGAAKGTRTPDPRITNALLYQLSYRGFGRSREGGALIHESFGGGYSFAGSRARRR